MFICKLVDFEKSWFRDEQVKMLDHPASIISVLPWASHFSISIGERLGWLMT
jgi:hypothetical protein